MSTRQYIGARYVPKFSGLYDPTQAYDALEVVDNGSGTTYIARIQTPPNTPLTDTTHWLVYGSSSGAILDLQSRVGSLENDNTTIKASILTMGGEISDNTSNISTLETDVAEIKNTLKKNILFIFDSYGGYPDNNGVDFDALLPNVMGLDAAHHVSKTRGGIGFTNANLQGTFLDFLQSFTPLLPNKDKFTHVMILGGANDYGVSQADIGTAIKNTIDYIKNYYPNAQPVIGYISQTRDFSQTARTPQQVWLNIYNACTAYRNCINYGAIYLTGCEYVMRDRSLYGSDGIHPNAVGVTKLAQCIRTSFDHGYVDIKYSWDYPGTFNTDQSDYTSGSSFARIFGATIKNDLTTVSFANARLDLVQTAGVAKTNVTKIIKIDNTVKNVINQSGINGQIAIASCWNGSTFVAYVPTRFYIDTEGDISMQLQVGVMPNPSATITNLYIPLQGAVAFDTLMT